MERAPAPRRHDVDPDNEHEYRTECKSCGLTGRSWFRRRDMESVRFCCYPCVGSAPVECVKTGKTRPYQSKFR